MLHAVVIGIDRYADPRISPLKHACDDAEAFASYVELAIHPDDRRVVLLENEQATAEAIRVAIGEELPRAARSRSDVLLLYFAGHGSPETRDGPDHTSRYLVAHDTSYDRIFATGLDMERDVARFIERNADPALVLFFLDACFSGRAGGRTFEGPNLRRARSTNRSVRLRLEDMDLAEGRAIITASDDDEVATEDTRLGHGVFTHALLDVLSKDCSDASTISVAELYDRVARRVSEVTAGRQHPILNGRIRGARLPLGSPDHLIG